ncbi:MAG: hypothetical protein LBM71_05325 [Elusimicrobiota bacterium]|jgi:hypothetical protein|nr:hypothetical protein [Elusimicrobiota bacterium]
MKSKILFLTCLICFLAACSAKQNYKVYQGISYDEYEKQGQAAKPTDGAQTAPIQDEITQTDLTTVAIAALPAEDDIIESVNSSYGEAVVVMASKKISLGKNAVADDLVVFQTGLDAAYQNTLLGYNADGFTYSISPAGTINPLSTIEVRCLLSENSADTKGKVVCDYFFSQIPLEYAKAKELKMQEEAKLKEEARLQEEAQRTNNETI